MARYNDILYGETTYGGNIREGTYLGPIIDAGFTLPEGTLTLSFTVSDQTMIYDDTDDSIFVYDGTWTNMTGQTGPFGGTYAYTSEANANVTISFYGDSIRVYYNTTSSGGQATVSLDGEAQSNINMYSVSTVYGVYTDYTGLNFGSHTLILTRSSGTIYIDRIRVDSTYAQTKIRAGNTLVPDASWTAWSAYSNSTIVSTDYDGYRYLQFETQMISSASHYNQFSLDSVNINYASGGIFFDEGYWVGTIDIGATFSQYEEIEWVRSDSNVACSIEVMTQTSTTEAGTYSLLSNPYTTSLGVLELTSGQNTGTLTTGLISPENLDAWVDLVTDYYLATDSAISCDILDSTNAELISDADPADLDLSTIDEPIKVRFELARTAGGNTPYIDTAILIADCIYSDTEDTVGTVCAHEETEVQTTLADVFTRPSNYLGDITYTVTDNTGDSDIRMYWDSLGEESTATSTTDDSDALYAITDKPKHYQYGSGMAASDGSDIIMQEAFAPSIPVGGEYRYLLEEGWIGQGATINENVTISWLSDPGSTAPVETTISVHNGDIENDSIYAILESSQISDWTSNEAEFILSAVSQVTDGWSFSLTPAGVRTGDTWPSIDEDIIFLTDPWVIRILSTSPDLDRELSYEIAPTDVSATATDEEIIPDESGYDQLGYARVIEITKIANAPLGADLGYIEGTDYNITNSNKIDWITTQPAFTYYVTYSYTNTTDITIKILSDEDDQVETITYEIWKSTGYHSDTDLTVSPDEDFTSDAIPDFDESATWGALPADIEESTLRYRVEDNNPGVLTSIISDDDGYYVYGTLKEKLPALEWHPLIRSGFYYFKDRDSYWLCAEPQRIVVRSGIVTNVYKGHLEDTGDPNLGREVTSQTIAISPLQREWSPIIVMRYNSGDDTYTRLKQVTQVDSSDMSYILTVTDSPVAYLDGETLKLKLQYNNPIEATLVVQSGATVLTVDSIYDNIVTIDTSNPDLYAGTTLTATYKVEDSYVVNSDSGLLIGFAEDETDFDIIYDVGEINSYIALETEINPLLSYIDRGYVFVDNNPQNLDHFVINIYPDSAPADGYTRTMVIIQSLDASGNPATNASLTAVASLYPSNLSTIGTSAIPFSGYSVVYYTSPLSAADLEETITMTDATSGHSAKVFLSLEGVS